MKLISCALTIRQIYARMKTETRRLGWDDVQPGQLLCFVDRCMGFKKGEGPRRIAVVRVTEVTREPLNRIKPCDVVAEGFPTLSCADFVEMFASNMSCTRRAKVTVIRFQFIPGGRFPIDGICRRCGCVGDDACYDVAEGSCWWVDSDLCSHCEEGFCADECQRPDFLMEAWLP